jgi:hypothetical protein
MHCSNPPDKLSETNDIAVAAQDSASVVVSPDSAYPIHAKAIDQAVAKITEKAIFQVKSFETSYTWEGKQYRMKVDENVLGLVKNHTDILSVSDEVFYRMFPDGHFGAEMCYYTAMPAGQHRKYQQLARSIGFDDIAYRCFVEQNGTTSRQLLMPSLTVRFNDRLQEEVDQILQNDKIASVIYVEVLNTYTVFPKSIAAANIVKLHNWLSSFERTDVSYNFGSCDNNVVPYD